MIKIIERKPRNTGNLPGLLSTRIGLVEVEWCFDKQTDGLDGRA